MTKIEWCDETINPIVGCSKISPGCQNCYAEKMAWRLKCMGNPKYQDVIDRNGWTGQIHCDLGQFHSLPKSPKKVFVVSMGDLFYENISDGSIAMVFYAMRDYPQHTYIVLTKRPGRMKFFFKRKISPNCIKGIPNLWLGVTAENQKEANRRVGILSRIQAAILLVSVEPMLGEVDLTYFKCPGCGKVYHWHQSRKAVRLNCPGCWEEIPCDTAHKHRVKPGWVICGAETGPGARPMKLEWARDLRDQCKRDNIPFFFKSAGKQETPSDLMVREFPV